MSCELSDLSTGLVCSGQIRAPQGGGSSGGRLNSEG
jgi:hypothetical protein